jgi:transposase-like protein
VASKGNIEPQGVYLDFEEALADGFTKVFPNASVRRDLFHFVQANVKKVGQLGMKSDSHEIVVALNLLWHKATKAEFDAYLNEFLDEWDRRAPQYTSYFRSTWLNRYTPAEWASYARPSNARSGNHICFFSSFLGIGIREY